MQDQSSYQLFTKILEGVKEHGLSDAVLQLEPLVAKTQGPGLQGEMARLLGFYWLRRGEHAKALAHNRLAAQRLPHNPDCVYNLVYSLWQLGQLDEALQAAQQGLQHFGDHLDLFTLQANLLSLAGRFEEARQHASQALKLKDALTLNKPGRDLSGVPLPPFDATQPLRNIISFSVFGHQRKYLDGALANAEAVRHVYPGWTCRFHVDHSVPEHVVQRLLSQGAQVARMPSELAAQPWGTFWRFVIANDPQVHRFLVRDADSLINLREAAAVQEWLASGCHFHLMRDHFDHSELVLAGMWGGVGGALPAVVPAARSYPHQMGRVQPRTADQEFLREELWPTIRLSLMAHDSQFRFGNSREFPAWARLPPGCFVGGQASELLKFGPKLLAPQT